MNNTRSSTELWGAATPLGITDTTLRDGHQSLAATRMRTEDMVPIAAEMDSAGFHSIEVWGGATFDVCTRFLFEDPWERLRTLRRLMPRTPLMMLLRGQNMVGYRHYADDVVHAFVRHSVECGIQIFRIFDALNDERNLQTAVEAVKAAGAHAQMAICYSVTEEGRMGGPVYNLDYFMGKARIFERMGADSICIKDQGGILAPYDSYALVKALRATVRVPTHLHTHYTSGMASMSVLKAAEAGVDASDAALSPLALRTSQPAVEPLVVALRGTPRDTGLDMSRLKRFVDYLEGLAPRLRPHMVDPRLSVIDTDVLTHQVPGGMLSNLLSQLKEAGALDRLQEVLKELPRTRSELGYPPLVTPTSQIVGVQSVNNVLFGRWKAITAQVRDYAAGLYGHTPAPIDAAVARLALEGHPQGQNPVTGRPADLLGHEMPRAEQATKGLAKDIGDVLIYALYPTTGLRFLRVKYGLEKKPVEETRPAPAAPAPTPSPVPRARIYQVAVSGQRFEVTVESAGEVSAQGPGHTPQVVASMAPPAQPAAAPQVAPGDTAVSAPLPGILVRYSVEEGQRVEEGETVAILEALKMENPIRAPRSGLVKRLTSQPGQRVQQGQVLAVIAPA
ncbi:MAG: pyruvate carboxylase subunit B [Chloroflexi bacterium]|nr:pyruvate carboxylase subunit B [Chloroflexota bacterium]